MAKEIAFDLARHEDTVDLGRRLSGFARPGLLILLAGNLGAGKTTLVQGLVESLGGGFEAKSPTFALMYEYPCVPPVLHVDLYRVETGEGLGIEEYLESHLVIVEWPDRLPESILQLPRIELALDFKGEGRVVAITDFDSGTDIEALLPPDSEGD